MKIYCPRCGQEQISPEVRFCSRCGFLMSGLPEIVLTGGVPQHLTASAPKPQTPRRKGIRQGALWFLLGILAVPLLGVMSELINFPDAIIGMAAILFFVGGIVRMIYALIFESGNPAEKTLEENVMATAQKLMNKQPSQQALPPQQSIPTEGYMPPQRVEWRDTNDLEPTSVTDSTTKLLNKE